MKRYKKHEIIEEIKRIFTRRKKIKEETLIKEIVKKGFKKGYVVRIILFLRDIRVLKKEFNMKTYAYYIAKDVQFKLIDEFLKGVHVRKSA